MFRQQHLPEPDSSGPALKLFSKIDLCGFKMPGFLNIGNRAFFCGKKDGAILKMCPKGHKKVVDFSREDFV